MGSPLDLALANIFMCNFESKWPRNFLNDFKPVFSRRYIDDIFALFSFSNHLDKFKEYLSSKNPNIILLFTLLFTLFTQNGCLPFLDVNIFRENKKFEGWTNCAHGNKSACKVHTTRFSRARNYVLVNQIKHLQRVLQCYLR